MAEATKNVSYGDFILNAMKESNLYNTSSSSIDDYWYAPIEDRETDLISESVKRGALYLSRRTA